MFNEIRHDFMIEGVKASFSIGKLARKSQSSVLAQMGDTVILASANVAAPFGDGDYFPLGVEYIEKMYAAGRISGSRFVKRDRFPSDDAILKARIIDRSIRSMFPNDYRDEVQVIVKILSYDPDYDPLLLGINAVSAALLVSKAPFNTPISGVRVGYQNDSFYYSQKHVDRDNVDESSLDLVIAGDGVNITNIDSNAFELSEEKYIDAMQFGLEGMAEWLKAQRDFVEKVGNVEKPAYTPYGLDESTLKEIESKYGDEVAGNLVAKNFKELKEKTLAAMNEEYTGKISKKQLEEAYESLAKKELQRLVLKEDKRVDGRALDEIRPMDFEVSLLPRVHGSGLFTRGMTQVMTIATLGSSKNQMMIDDMTGEDERRYMHYYVEAPYSFGEVNKYKYIPGRREVGHGSLAEKALIPVLPDPSVFPYTIILVSEIMSEEGSSSMASTCGSTLALMDAGVPIKKPVAGIAMGVILDKENGGYKLLTDIQGLEDFYGYMDFKVTGTRDGVTAIQMDTKAPGLPLEIFKEAIMRSREARLKILAGMTSVIAKPREALSEYAPRVSVVKIPESKIGELIGPGGKNIKRIIETTGAELNVEDNGDVQIFADNDEALQSAKAMVTEYAFEPMKGQTYVGTVAKIVEFGAFVRLAPGVEGLLHISELSDSFVKDVHDFLKEGDKVEVKILDIDPSGKMKLSKKAVDGGSSSSAEVEESSARMEN